MKVPSLVRASATKTHATFSSRSRVELWQVERGRSTDDNWFFVMPTGAACTKVWKASLRNALLQSEACQQAPGPVALEISFRCSPQRRNWINLWKGAGDALGPLLGEPDPRNPFNPADDRIVELALHLDADESMGNDVVLGLRCCPLAPRIAA
jgi:hypothetical protein